MNGSGPPPGPGAVNGQQDLRAEVEALRAKLAEAEEMLGAIRSGLVDALVITGEESGERVYTLQGAETPYRVLVEQMAEGAVMVCPDGNVLYANRRFAEMVGMPLERVMGVPLANWVPDPAALAAFLGEARAHPVKRELILGLGRRVPVAIAGSPLPEQPGRIALVVTDLSEFHRTRALEEAQSALSHKAGELARSNAELAGFAHVAAHDLKEPLRGIRHIVGFVREDYGPALGAEGQGRLEALDRLTARMEGLLDSLLEYSRVGQELRTRRVELGLVAAEVLAALGPWLREHAGAVSVGPLPSMECDPVLAGRLFQNLIVNGVKYNDSMPRRVEVGAAPGEHGPILYVRDNGIGIPPEHHETVFRMFKRISRDERHGGGTGAGLAIVKKIVEHHGGRIWLESAVGQGTTVYFTLEAVCGGAEALELGILGMRPSIAARA